MRKFQNLVNMMIENKAIDYSNLDRDMLISLCYNGRVPFPEEFSEMSKKYWKREKIQDFI